MQQRYAHSRHEEDQTMSTSATILQQTRRPAGTATSGPGSPDMSGVFETIADGHDYTVQEIDGCIPADLRGTLYRNGPSRNEIDGTPFAHLFDGDGMLSQFTIADGGVRYRNRFVRTTHYLGERSAKEPRYRGFGAQRAGGLAANAFRMPGAASNPANTSVVLHAGNLLALWEGGHPWRLDPYTLQTIGEEDFGGALKRAHAFSAHPKLDPNTGELFNFGVQYGPRTRIQTYRVDRAGRLCYLQPVTLPYPVLNHDFALTAKHMIFVIDPLVLRMTRFLTGFSSLDRAFRWDSSRATRIILVPRDGGKPRVAECDPFFHFHFANAFEDGPDTVIDLCRYEDYAIGELLRNFKGAGEISAHSSLWRLRVTPAGQVEQSELCPFQAEFPQLDTTLTGERNRYTYLAARPSGPGYPTAVVKLDNDTGECRSFDLGVGFGMGEPIFVPRPQRKDEDDGWLLALVYDGAEHRSRLYILDARDVQGEPLAVAHLPHHVPYGFHGTFTPRVAAS
jgi:all-trans-8'-apo-beta-carotenal 15,15'-oxygenase